MAAEFVLIAITPEQPVDREGKKITALLSEGWHRVHLRHPEASRTEMRDIIESIPQRLHSRLVLHGHFDLLNEYNLGGLHLNRRCPVPPALYNGPLSRSCHTLAEIYESDGFEYVTLSPIFDSISKNGYTSAFNLDSLILPKGNIIALGGVASSNIAKLKERGFAGAALLGDIPWDKDTDTIHTYAKHIYDLC